MMTLAAAGVFVVVTAKLLHKLGKTSIMKKVSYVWLCMLAMVMSLSSCQAIEGIFKAGMWFGIIIVVAIIVLILWLVGRSRK